MPRDTRTYITLSDGMVQNAKILPLSDKAFRTLIELWSWCSRERTDGIVPRAVLKIFGTPKARAELVQAGLIDENPDGNPDHVQMHDYLEHQRSRAEIEQASARSRANGAKGGRPRKASSETQTETQQVTDSEPRNTQKSETETEELDRVELSRPVDGAPSSDDEGTLPVDKPVGNVDSEKVKRALEKLAPGHIVAWSMASACIATILGSAPAPGPRLPERYVLASIAREPERWRHFVVTGVLAAS